MVGWIILGVLTGIIVLILMIPVGVDFRYEEGVIRLSAKAAGVSLQLIPKPKREAKPEKAKKEKKPEKPKEEQAAEGKKKRSIPFNAEEILELLKMVLNRFGRFNRKFKVDRFVLHWIAPMWNPYVSARIFAVVNDIMSQLAPICEQRFHCRNSSVWTDIDFTREDMFLEFGLAMTIRIGQILGTGLSIAFGALRIYLRSSRRTKREAREEERALADWLREHPENAALSGQEEQSA
ncbi:MAG: hypothetical protein K6C08_08245 [Oscillospiraceae bacterium]|nr:hypothetical protein [Oscillospiraceae bacterium]